MKTKAASAVSKKSVSFLGCHFERAKRVEKSINKRFLHCTHPDKSGFVPVEMTRKCELVFKDGTKFRRGFSLIEAVLATVLLGAAAAGILVPFTSGAQVQAEGKRKVIAAKLAGNVLEEIIAADFTDITDYSGSQAEGELYTMQGEKIEDTAYSGFSREWVCQHPYAGSDKLVLATVTVKYRGREMIELKRLIAE